MVIRAALAVTAIAAAAACSAPAPGPAEHTTATAAPSAPAQAGPVLDITIADGAVTPVNAELSATVGTPITLRVTSDADDELHVHAVPEHSFAVRPGAGQHFEFTVDVPGRVEVELHHLDRTVATINVHP